jgi:hypothetical protein
MIESYDAEIKSAVDQWLGDIEAYSLRSERMPVGSLPWLYEAAKIGAKAALDECETEKRIFDDVAADLNDCYDKIEGLSADLDAAIEVAWKRGAHDWVRLNYPKHYTRFVHGE